MQNVDKQDVESRKVQRLEFLLNGLKKVRSIQSGLLQLSELASQVNDLSKFYPELNKVVASFVNVDNFYVALEQSHGLAIEYFSDEKDDSSLPKSATLERGITGYVYKTGKPILCDRKKYQQLAAQGEFEVLGTEPELWFGVPLMRGDYCIGVMAIQSYDARIHLTERTQVLFESLGLHLSTAIARVKRREFLELEVKRQTANLEQINRNLNSEITQRKQAEKLQKVLFQISEISSSTADMQDFYKQLHQALSQLMDATNCYIALVNDDWLIFPYFVDKYTHSCRPRKLADGLTEYTLRTKRSHLINKDKAAELMASGEIGKQTVNKAMVASCWLGAPLIVDDQVRGVITIQSYQDEVQYDELDLQLLTFVSHHIARAIERKLAAEKLQKSYDELEKKIFDRTQELRQTNLFLRLQVEERKKAEQKLFHQANHDSLTSLPNRSLFQSKVEVVLARTKRHPEHNFALLFIDLDNFKLINDVHGHQVGDDFLVEVSERLKRCVRDNDTVARLGGDEFVILLDLLPSSETAEEIANRIIEDVKQPFGDELNLVSGASIGIAMFEPSYTTVDEIMRDADLAMYQAKSLGRSQFVVFTDALRQDSDEQMSVQNVTKYAIADGHLHLTASPIFAMSSEQVACHLLQRRWDHTILGDIEFNDEASHLLDGKDKAAFEREYLRLLQVKVQDSNEILLMAVSADHLSHAKYVKQLIDVFESSLLDSQVCLLFSEHELGQLSDAVFRNLKLLKRAGFNIGIRDFGHHLSAAGLLTKAVFDFVLFDKKMIRSIAANPANAILLNSMIELASKLKVKPVICGIDAQQHFERLQRLPVDLACGQYITEQQKKTEFNVNEETSAIKHRA
ncbi:MAG: diguanylate cyclase [Gammaproteobacteria bacterium]|nr:diguanylate cyclase [Gammaproteobacteria bacterium]